MPELYCRNAKSSCRNAITVLGTLASYAAIENFFVKKIILITKLYTEDSYPSFSPHYLYPIFKSYLDKPQAWEKHSYEINKTGNMCQLG